MSPMLTGEAALVEEGLFLGRGDAAEHLVAMGEAAETADDVLVQLRPLQKLGVASRGEQCAAALLIGELFRVFERQIEELLVGDRPSAIEAVRKRSSGDRAGNGIGREGAGVVAE